MKAPPAAAILELDTGLVQGYFRYAVGTRSPWELLALWWRLFWWRPDVLVYLGAPRGVGSAQRDAKFFRLCGIRRQIGVPVTEEMQQNRWIEASQDLEPEGERLVRNIAELGEGELDSPAAWDLHLTAAEHARAAEVMLAVGQMRVIAVSVGTKVQSKDWGKENWRELLRRLGGMYPEYALVLNGAPEESAASEFAADGWREVNPGGVVVNICGKLTPPPPPPPPGECRGFCPRTIICWARQRTDAPGGGGPDPVCGDLCSAKQAAGVVSVWEAASGAVSPDGVLGVRAGDLHCGEEAVSDVDHRGRGGGDGQGVAGVTVSRICIKMR